MEKPEYVIAWAGYNPWHSIYQGVRFFEKGEINGESKGISDQILAEEMGLA